MLSDAQCEVVKNRINAEADIPFLREEAEGHVIEKVIDTINPRIEPAMRAICPAPYVECLKIALKEGLSSSEKRRKISTILRGELEEPLAKRLAGNIDVALLPEDAEEALMKVVAQKVIEEFVEWTVGEMDERLSTRLDETRAAAGVTSEEKNSGCNVA